MPDGSPTPKDTMILSSEGKSKLVVASQFSQEAANWEKRVGHGSAPAAQALCQQVGIARNEQESSSQEGYPSALVRTYRELSSTLAEPGSSLDEPQKEIASKLLTHNIDALQEELSTAQERNRQGVTNKLKLLTKAKDTLFPSS
ncbi:hypothetical protein A2899_03380 [Candidatus Amesbacteria bacterium RIFCSPLOWO2_01_FULL_49_25]|uniref:Uncharacterized protein n=1 Tax=Candidatus Amesbacteria bacterium RIFCSPHIGHO2_01_FULL_48_32b TaxID=1797253 RepID=A0A1F4YEN9_9BACT|nr:MAG: hypothetical protein A2876_02280 [Candidatus Amesbacteria bacterium RIFCSPHIGHO2_01_FULL_48_32b]OGD06913.1 MAG: hypothetical protein A2899_03380 [Candidatus Amesbacteria bacterium RIFCSPLOWO2_01_FULL_49_25]